jgi:hypothetical protein
LLWRSPAGTLTACQRWLPANGFVSKVVSIMTLSRFSRIAAFIDGPNLYATAKALDFELDYERLLNELRSRGTLTRAFYYTAIIEDQEYTSIRPLVDWLDYNGFTVITKASKEFFDANGRRKIKGNMAIELAVHAMESAQHVDEIIRSRATEISGCWSRHCSGAGCA